jgi:pimeloyl-ACP methyl ester carboxylesterase
MPSVRINHCDVELIRQGSGQPVVLLHSAGASATQWRALIDTLSARFLVLAPDLYGYGGTAPWPGHAEYSLGEEAALVGALLDTLDEPPHLVGHSYGGAVALHVARQRPAGLRSLTLIEPVAFHLLRDGDEIDKAALLEFIKGGKSVTRALCRGEYHCGFEYFVDYWNGPGTWAAMPMARRSDLAPRLAQLALTFHATTGDAACLEDFESIDVPTLLVQGSNTTLPARRACCRLALAWPQAQLRIIPGAGHMSPVTHREEVNPLIAAHLDAHAARHPDAAVMSF